MATTVSINLLILGYFKYASFLAENISPGFILPFGGWAPLAISFYTFHIISYAIDLYERKYPISRPLDYAAYLSFFPHLIAGPIVRGNQLLPQLERPIPQHLFDWTGGARTFALGFFFKVVADKIAGAIDPYWTEAAPQVSTTAHWLVALLYSGQIFGDFAGYSLMAIGIAKLLGYELPENFDAPYTATSFRDFWRRWHITLSAFLRDYLYIFGLGGNRRGKARALVNLGITMLLGGLWHGPAWHFVLWGGIHGAALIVERLFGSVGERLAPPLLRCLVGWVIVQITVVVAWVIFRSPDVDSAVRFLRRMVVADPSAPTPAELIYTLPMLIPFAMHHVAKRFNMISQMSGPLQGALVGVTAVLAVMLWGTTRGFIYFNF